MCFCVCVLLAYLGAYMLCCLYIYVCLCVYIKCVFMCVFDWLIDCGGVSVLCL